jgi:dipeptidyl aminopeptidase/acylaminoacyl peptidase
MTGLKHMKANRYTIQYNIDGCDWLYEGAFDESNLTMNLEQVLVGQGMLSNGVLESYSYEEASDRYALSYSTATSPTQIYSLEGPDRQKTCLHTCERILGAPQDWLSPGEDVSYPSFDGTRVSARLYLPAPALGFTGKRPLIFYIHGGPQSQERPDFAWFSMPLIQYLTLSGFAVFVPNVRGSSGYGLKYMKQVDRDWGGNDRLDHIYAMQQVLPKDERLDISRTGVVGRSYGGYMTLTLATRHPGLWSAAVDMFGPYDLITFSERIPASWKPYYKLVIGDPEDAEDRKLLVERSPNTYLGDMECPMLVIQGANDPRVVAAESADLVNELKADGKDIDLLLFEDEGHDVLKYKNRVACYNAIVDFFAEKLGES